jgi:hypothetical protein
VKYSLQQAKNAARIVAASELAHAADLLLRSESSQTRSCGALISMRIGPLLRLETEPYCDDLDELTPFLDLEAECLKNEKQCDDGSDTNNA